MNAVHAVLGGRTADKHDAPKVGYWHIWTDTDGVSHQTRCELAAFELKGVGNAAPQWNDKQDGSEATVVFTVQPVGWIGEWHENPKPQWIVPLSGRWFVESMDGTRIEMGAGRDFPGRGPELRRGRTRPQGTPLRHDR